jgi:hypothetical protein
MAVSRVLERSWQPSNDLESRTLPEAHRSLVGADDEVELHPVPKTVFLRQVGRQRVRGSFPYDGLENAPDCAFVARLRLPDIHGTLHEEPNDWQSCRPLVP